MRSLASVVMRGRSQAVMLTSLLAMLSFLFPPISILSSAIIALVTLRQGPTQGLVVLLLSMLACGILAQLTLGGFIPVILLVLLMWLPVWLVAWLLRFSRSLAFSLLGALALGLVIIAGQFLQTTDPVTAWKSDLETFAAPLVEGQVLAEADKQMLIEVMAKWMPGIVATGFFLHSVAALLLGRWWQSVLYNPGGFRLEFHQLRLPRLLAVITLLLLLLLLISSGADKLILDYSVMLLMAVWFLQGLALIHGLVGQYGASVGWLGGVYALLFLAMPYVATLLSAAGFADAWLDLRARFKPGHGSGNTN